MRYLCALALGCFAVLPLNAEEVTIVVEKTAGKSETFTVSKKLVQLYGISLDMDSGGVSHTVKAVCKNKKVIITEKNVSSNDGVDCDSVKTVSIAFRRLPYVYTPTDQGVIKKIRISAVKAIEERKFK